MVWLGLVSLSLPDTLSTKGGNSGEIWRQKQVDYEI